MRALLICKNFQEVPITGIGIRQLEIRNILLDLGFKVIVKRRPPFIFGRKYDLTCVQSFRNAGYLLIARLNSRILWYDAMDSWRVTRKTLKSEQRVREFVKYIRDWMFSKLVNISDFVTYCSRQDANNDYPNLRKPLFILPPRVRVNGNINELPDYGKRWVFVGTSDYIPNRLAIDFLKHCQAQGAFEDLPLYVYGANTEKNEKIHNVYFCGSRDEIEIYGRNDIHLAPIWSGAGIKYKVVNPISKGLRVLTSPEGANGISSKNLIVADNQWEFLNLLNLSLFELGSETTIRFECDDYESIMEFIKKYEKK